MGINLKKYLEDMLKDRKLKLENDKNRYKDFYRGQVCIIEDILFDIENGYIKINKWNYK